MTSPDTEPTGPLEALRRLFTAVDIEMGDTDLPDDTREIYLAMQQAAPFVGDDYPPEPTKCRHCGELQQKHIRTLIGHTWSLDCPDGKRGYKPTTTVTSEARELCAECGETRERCEGLGRVHPAGASHAFEPTATVTSEARPDPVMIADLVYGDVKHGQRDAAIRRLRRVITTAEQRGRDEERERIRLGVDRIEQQYHGRINAVCEQVFRLLRDRTKDTQ